MTKALAGLVGAVAVVAGLWFLVHVSDQKGYERAKKEDASASALEIERQTQSSQEAVAAAEQKAVEVAATNAELREKLDATLEQLKASGDCILDGESVDKLQQLQ